MNQNINELLRDMTNRELQDVQNEVVRLKMLNNSVEFM